MRYINTTDENISFTDVDGRVVIVPKNRVYTHFNVDTITFLLVERYESEGVCLFTTRAEDLAINGVVYTFEQLLSGSGIDNMYSPTGLIIKLVDQLPTTGEDSTIYLIANDKGSYTEYLWLKDNNKWEELGDITRIDLSNYFTKAEINAMFADYYTQTEIDTMFDDYYTKSETYTKTEVDDELALKADADDVYDKTTANATFATQVVVNQEIASRLQAETDLQSQINSKADKSDTYTKAQVDTAITTAVNSIDLTPYETIADHNADVADLEDAIALKADATDLADYATVTSVENGFAEVNSAIDDLSDVVDTKANAADVYTKAQVDDEINDTNQVTSEAISTLRDIIVDNERTTTEAIIDLDNRKTDLSVLESYVDKPYVDNNFVGKQVFDIKEETISRALTELHKQMPDISSYPTTADLNTALQTKQDVLTAGTNITIENNVISASGGGGGTLTQVQTDWNQSDSTAVDYIKNKPTIPTVPTNVSSFTNDAGYLTQHQSLSNYYTKTEIDNKIGDIETILASL